MNSKLARSLVIVALCAALGAFTDAALAADGDGAESLTQAFTLRNQPQPPAQQQQTVALERSAGAPSLAGAHSERRTAEAQPVPAAQQLNVPGNAAFGRIATS